MANEQNEPTALDLMQKEIEMLIFEASNTAPNRSAQKEISAIEDNFLEEISDISEITAKQAIEIFGNVLEQLRKAKCK